MPVPPPSLPSDFLFGVATADHQVEAHLQGSDDIRDEWERIRGLQRRGAATDFWTRYAEDVRLAASLGCRIFRVSLSWARLEPTANSWDTTVEQHYRALLHCIRAAGMKTVVSLHHNTWPLEVQAIGGGQGMLHDGFPSLFASYAEKVATTLGDLIDYYITINEPNQLIYGFIKGFWMRAYPMPPGVDAFASQKHQMAQVLTLIPNLFRAHAQARSAIHSVRLGSMVGSNPLILGLPRWLRALIDWQATHARPEQLLAQSRRFSQRLFVGSGEVDISIAQLTMTQSRMDKVLFSEPYFLGHLVAMHRPELGIPASFGIWNGRIGVTRQTAPASLAEKYFPNAAINEYPTTDATVTAVRNGEIDVAFDDDVMLQQYAGSGLVMTALSAPAQCFATAVALGSRTLLNAVDLALRKFKGSSSGTSAWKREVSRFFPAIAAAGPPDLDNRKTVANIGRSSAALPEPSDVPDMDGSLGFIRKRGTLRVGVHPGVPGLCERKADGTYEGLEPTIGRFVATQILDTDNPKIEFIELNGDRRVEAARSWLSMLDPIRKFAALTTTVAAANWWNLGMAGLLPDFLCPKECIGSLDFVGLDYYWGVDSFTDAHRLLPAMECRYSDAPVYPRGLLELLRAEHRRFPEKPILVIENGCVDNADGLSRSDYIASHVEQAQRAVAEGIPLHAYLCWAITSNREWGLAFDHNSDFGLYHIDLDHDLSLTRVPTEASARYAQIINNRSV